MVWRALPTMIVLRDLDRWKIVGVAGLVRVDDASASANEVHHRAATAHIDVALKMSALSEAPPVARTV